MIVLRELIGDTLRTQRVRRGMTLRDVSAKARVSLGYISEVERGQKEPSSELLAALCDALGFSLSRLLREVSVQLELVEQLESLVPDDVSKVREPVSVG
ncbi:MAG: helix-turn-helix domain-containing protein [Nocardioidaceae bacterium]